MSSEFRAFQYLFNSVSSFTLLTYHLARCAPATQNLSFFNDIILYLTPLAFCSIWRAQRVLLRH